MRLKINSYIKYLALIVLAIGIFFFIASIIRYCTNRPSKSNQVVEYQYSNQVLPSYLVNIKENSVFDSRTLEEELEYTKKLLDSITILFDNQFEASSSSTVEYSYNIVGEVRGYKGTGDKKKVYWTKRYPYVEKNNEKKEGKKLQFQDEVIVTLEEYETFVKQARIETGYDLGAELCVKMEGYMRVDSDYGQKEGPIHASVTIPLNQDSFTITKSQDDPHKEQVVRQEEVILPFNYIKMVGYVIGIFLMLSGVVILLKYAQEPTEQDKIYKRVKKIWQEYGSRIVKIQDTNQEEIETFCDLSSIEDIIKISDELQQPIYYSERKEKGKEYFYFRIQDKTKEYQYCIEVGEK